jgi:hypothetical protein
MLLRTLREFIYATFWGDTALFFEPNGGICVLQLETSRFSRKTEEKGGRDVVLAP